MFPTKNNRRLINEKKKIETTPSSYFFVQPNHDNLFEWHFTLRGLKDTDYEGGLYHGKIILPDEYPLKAPDLVFLTKNGRFETGKNVCLSITSYHNESWTPAWNIITILEAVGAFFLVEEPGIGYVKADSVQRKQLAKDSRNFKCEQCGQNAQMVEEIMMENEKKMANPPKPNAAPQAMKGPSDINQGTQPAHPSNMGMPHK